MTELCEVVITAPDPGWLKDLSRKLIEQRLCASAHNFAPVQSIYRWRGEIYKRTEGRVAKRQEAPRPALVGECGRAIPESVCPAASCAFGARPVGPGHPSLSMQRLCAKSPGGPQSENAASRNCPIRTFFSPRIL